MKVPILRLQGILLNSIQIDMSDEVALSFQDDVLDALSRTDAKGVVIDITAMDVVDSFMARVINDTANMAGMLGAPGCAVRHAAGRGAHADRDGAGVGQGADGA